MFHGVELYSFTVPGRPIGYYSQGARPNWTRKRLYEDYKKNIQKSLALAGISRDEIRATKDHPLLVHTKAYFASGNHCDPENNRKAISDAIFYRKTGRGCGDKYCGGSFYPPLYDRENPRTEVVIERFIAGTEEIA